jgi:gas vesicle protein
MKYAKMLNERKNDIVIEQYRKMMATNKHIGIIVDEQYKARFQKRCIDHKTTMSKVIKNAISEFMETHQPKEEKFTGIT